MQKPRYLASAGCPVLPSPRPAEPRQTCVKAVRLLGVCLSSHSPGDHERNPQLPRAALQVRAGLGLAPWESAGVENCCYSVLDCVQAKPFPLPGVMRKHRDFQTCIAREGLFCFGGGGFFFFFPFFFLHEVFSQLCGAGATVVILVTGYLRREGSSWVAKISRDLFTTPCQCSYFIPTGAAFF